MTKHIQTHIKTLQIKCKTQCITEAEVTLLEYYRVKGAKKTCHSHALEAAILSRRTTGFQCLDFILPNGKNKKEVSLGVYNLESGGGGQHRLTQTGIFSFGCSGEAFDPNWVITIFLVPKGRSPPTSGNRIIFSALHYVLQA